MLIYAIVSRRPVLVLDGEGVHRKLPWDVLFKKPTIHAGKYKVNLLFGENGRYVLYKIEGIIGFEIASVFEKELSRVLPGLLYLNMSPTASL